MALTIPEFWKLAIESQLITPDEASKLHKTFTASHPGVNAVEELVRFLVGTKLTPYQAKILLAGRPGPFVYADYVIYERIETGRMAGIFRALHRLTGHRVCLMFLSGAATQDAALMVRLRNRVAGVGRASVGHPHLMRCYQLVDHSGFKFIVLEDIEGKRVERDLSTGGAMKVSDACRIIRQAALGLGRMHAMGQAHGAVRPAHLWLEPDHNVKLLNFPLIGDPTTEPKPLAQQVSQAGKVPPEADYIAPELIAGDQVPDARSDIYSLGCTLYHMLAGQPPFAGGDLGKKLARQMQEPPRPLHEVNPQVPEGLAKVVQYMLNKDPELRYQAANSVVEAILPFVSPHDAQTKPTPPTQRELAYEQWLKSQVPAANDELVEAVATEAMSAPITPAQPVAQAMPTAQPVAQAMPIGQAPVAMAMPVGTMPQGNPYVAQPAMGQPMMAQPLQAQPVMAAPVAAAGQMFPQAASPFPQATSASAQPFGGDAAPVNPAMNRVRRRKSSKMPLVIGVLLLAGGGAALHFSGALAKIQAKLASSSTKNVAPPASGTTTNKSPAKSVAPTAPDTTPGPNETAMANTPAGTNPAAATATPETDDPREKIFPLKDPVWDSPTKGPAIDTKYLAPGAQALIALRPAEIAKHEEGQRLLDASVSGYLGEWIQTELPKIAGLPVDKIEQVVISVLDGGASPPLPAYRIRTTEAVAHEALVAAWGNPTPDESAAGKLVFTKEQTKFYVPASGQQRVIVIGPEVAMKDVIETDGAATALPLELEVMLKQTDERRLATILGVPKVMLADGKPVFTGPLKLWRGQLETFLMSGDGSGDLPKAALASLHLDGDFFLELRMYDGTVGPQNEAPAQAIESRLRALPKQLRSYLLEVPPSKYSLPIVGGFEDMLRQLATMARVGVAEKQIVARVYLPSLAAHNLVMSSFLATIDHPQSGYAKLVPMGADAGKPAAASMSPAEAALAKVTSLSFDRQPLDKTIELLADDIGMPIMIDGPSLQIDGITKNQSINALAEENKPAKEILKVVLAKANLAGKLRYAIVPKDGVDTIYVTTVDGAKKNNWKLPADYAAADDKKK